MRKILLVMLVLLTAACSQSDLVEKGLTPQERAVMRGAIDDISRGDSASLLKKAPPALAGPIQSSFEPMRRALPQAPLEISAANADWVSGNGVRTGHAVYQVHGKSGWALLEATTRTSGGRTTLVGIYVKSTAVEPSKLNGFGFETAGSTKFAMLLAMLAAFAVTVAALIRVWRSGLFRHRWLWTIGCLVGVTTLRLNWSTGEFYFQPISVLLFSAAATKQPIYAPWVLAVGAPLVALVVLLRRKGHPAA